MVETKSHNAAGELLGNLHTLGGSTLAGHSYTADTTRTYLANGLLESVDVSVVPSAVPTALL